MKRYSALIIALILIFNSIAAFGQTNNAGFEGGIHRNERDNKKTKAYKEVIFITGEPVLVEGTVELTVRTRDLTYRYRTKSKDGSVTMDRDIKLTRTIDDKTHAKQTVEVNGISSYKEIVSVGGQGGNRTYTLTDYIFHNSSIDDKQPIISYYAGNWLGTKTYSINNNQGKVVVDITGDIYGYDHFWGATETQKINHFITYHLDADNAGEENQQWMGYVDVDVSFNRTKRMEYFNNLPHQSSFDGGYTLTEQEKTVMKYSYNLPYIQQDGKALSFRNRGKGEDFFETLPTQQKLYIPKYDDIKGHWAEQDIRRLSGLRIIDQEANFFGPDRRTTRTEFAKWIAVAMDLVEENSGPVRSFTRPTSAMTSLGDITRDNPDYKYIQAVVERGIMQGTGENLFSPNGTLTRAQAITTLVRAMGLERLAPNPPFETRFKDDKDIPQWARRSIYVADQIGLAKGTPNGYVYPNDPLTKAEAARFINTFITYLQEDLKKDYRENIINY